MGIIVQKFGGSSVADKDKLKNVANIITRSYDEGNKIVVVVSAQGKTTDSLVKKTQEITATPNKREYDVLLSEYQIIQQDLKDIYDNSPTTLDKAVSLARKALKIDGDYTYTDEEIDSYLPAMCRKGS